MKGIITIIIIIAIVVVGFLLLRDGTQPDSSDVDSSGQAQITEDTKVIGDSTEIDEELGDAPIDTTAEIIVVTYTNKGFTPKEIIVSAGQTVRFVNESSGNMWLASDPHPTHTILPEFDEKKSIGNGENYEFTFTEIGEWDYHNHVKPSAVGTVVVE